MTSGPNQNYYSPSKMQDGTSQRQNSSSPDKFTSTFDRRGEIGGGAIVTLNSPDKPLSFGANPLDFSMTPDARMNTLNKVTGGGSKFKPGPSGKAQFSLMNKQLRPSNTLEIPEMKKFAGKPLLSLGNDDD